MNARNQVPVIVRINPRGRGAGVTADHTILADIPAVRVGDPEWAHEAAKAIALSITEHFDTQGN